MSATWDTLYVWNCNGKLQLSGSTTGCGCCSESVYEENVDRAVLLVKEHITERQAEIAEWREWLKRVKKAKRMVE